MPNTENNKKVFVHPGFNPDNSKFKSCVVKGLDFSDGKVEEFDVSREGTGLKIISKGFVDRDKLIQSEAGNAGLANIIRLQSLRYGTIENAIYRNADKQVYADVSNIPTSVGEQKEYLADVNKEVEKLCSELGITKEQLAKSNQDTLEKLLAAKNSAKNETASNQEGGNE